MFQQNCVSKVTRWLMSMGLFVFLGVVPAQQPQERSPWLTFGEMNGRFWRLSTMNEKTAYMQGVKAALDVAVIQAIGTPCEAQSKGVWEGHLAAGLTVGESQDALDRFYGEPENLLIKITDALEIVSAKARGVPHDVIEVRISQRRLAAQEAPERR